MNSERRIGPFRAKVHRAEFSFWNLFQHHTNSGPQRQGQPNSLPLQLEPVLVHGVSTQRNKTAMTMMETPSLRREGVSGRGHHGRPCCEPSRKQNPGRVASSFQTAPARSSIESVHIERRIKEARRKDKAAAKRARRQTRRQQKGAAGSAKS
jgi:hypothetical protein